MKLNLTAVVLAAVVAAAAGPVFARDVVPQEARQTINLKDGLTLYVFKDGKMSMEDKYGRPLRMKAGQVMEA